MIFQTQIDRLWNAVAGNLEMLLDDVLAIIGLECLEMLNLLGLVP